MKKLLIFLCLLSQTSLAMEAALSEKTRMTLDIIKRENRDSKNSLYKISKAQEFSESYDFLKFIMKKSKKFPEQYNKLLEKLDKADDLYGALQDRKTKAMLRLVQFLDLTQGENLKAPIPVNYDIELCAHLFNIIKSHGSYEEFEKALVPIVNYVAASLESNAAINMRP